MIAPTECFFMYIGVIFIRILRDHEESNLFGWSEVLRFSPEIIYCRRSQPIIEMTKSNTVHISGQYCFFRDHVVESDGIE